MASDEIHVGDIGTVITTVIYDGTSIVDISTANTTTARLIVFGKPDGTFSTQGASFTGTGSDGSMAFTVNTSTFWDAEGAWRLQAIVYLGTSKFSSDVHDFKVYKNLV